MVMKFYVWIDLIKRECNAHEVLLLFAYFFSYCPLFIFILEFCLQHISKTILAMVVKFCGWIDLIKWECSANEPYLLLHLIFEFLPFVYYTRILSDAYLQNCTSYGYEILQGERSHQEGVHCS